MTSRPVNISFVGDMSFSDLLFCQGYGVRSTIKQTGPDFLFSKIKSILSSSDIVFGNLETVLSNIGEEKNSLLSVDMRGDPECVKALRRAGFTVLNLANNHSMQHGSIPFLETVKLLNESGIEQIGVKEATNDWHSSPVIKELRGMKIGFIGYSYEPDRYHPAPLYAQGCDQMILKDILKLKQCVDFLVLSVHWGLESIQRPSVITINRAHSFIDAGADIIVGHHPHVLQGIERYKGKIIAYSLGNFIFDMNWADIYRDSMILKVQIHNSTVYDYEIIPITNDHDYRPFPVLKPKLENKISNLNFLSKLIKQEGTGDLEKNSIRYYSDVTKILKKQRYLSYLYFLKNFHKYNKKFLPIQIKTTLKSRIEDYFGI